VAAPAAEEPAEDECREQGRRKIKPAFSCPSSSVAIDSEGSTGESVGLRPLKYHSRMWPAISRLTLMSTAARHREAFDFLMWCLSPLGFSVTTASEIVLGALWPLPHPALA
jgi:hypothetical protein